MGYAKLVISCVWENQIFNFNSLMFLKNNQS